jgi:PPOX class probable F420-dependent enzyme
MTTARSALDRIGDGKYVLLTTYRKDGTAVSTPVWVVRYSDDALAVWTVTATAKVKRIRRNRGVTVAPCTFRGKPLGESVSARAEIPRRGGYPAGP